MWLRRMASRRSTSMVAVASGPGDDRRRSATAADVATQTGQGEGGVDHLGDAGRRW